MKILNKIAHAAKKTVDEVHEQAALGFVAIGLGLELFTEFDDFATVGVLFLAGVTLLGSKRYHGVSIGTATNALRDIAEEYKKDE